MNEPVKSGMQVQEIGGHRFYVVGDAKATTDQRETFEREAGAFEDVRAKGLVDGWVVYEVKAADDWHYHSISPDGLVYLGGNPPYEED